MPFQNEKRYNDFSAYIKTLFAERVQKIALDTGFSCPNRDGTKGNGGCTYCNIHTYNPYYCQPDKSITQQLNEGIAFFSKKYKTQQYLAYFQPYTNTYSDVEALQKMYYEAITHPAVVGLVVSTRPDCISPEVIDLLSGIAKNYFVLLELGIESTLDRTLAIVNRCHTYADTKSAFKMAENKGIHLGGHLIIGLPQESKEDMLFHAKEISQLPVQMLKLHHLQIVKHTVMALQLQSHPEMFHLFSMEEYIELITEFIALLRPDIILERFTSETPPHLLIAPQWNGLKNFEIVAKINKKLIEKNLWQGKNYAN